MKFAASATLLMAALSTLSAAQDFISQTTAKPMIVKPGGLVTVSTQLVFSEDFDVEREFFYIDVSSARESTLPTTKT